MDSPSPSGRTPSPHAGARGGLVDWDLAARTAVAAAGYDVAFAVAREHGRFAVDRVFVQSTDSLTAFRLKRSAGDRVVSRAGGRAWRVRHLVRGAVAAARRR